MSKLAGGLYLHGYTELGGRLTWECDRWESARAQGCAVSSGPAPDAPGYSSLEWHLGYQLQHEAQAALVQECQPRPGWPRTLLGGFMRPARLRPCLQPTQLSSSGAASDRPADSCSFSSCLTRSAAKASPTTWPRSQTELERAAQTCLVSGRFDLFVPGNWEEP